MRVVTLYSLFCARIRPDPVNPLHIGSGYFRTKLFPFKYPNISQAKFILHTYLPMKMEQSVPKRQNIKFRRQRITQKHTTYYLISVALVPH